MNYFSHISKDAISKAYKFRMSQEATYNTEPRLLYRGLNRIDPTDIDLQIDTFGGILSTPYHFQHLNKKEINAPQSAYHLMGMNSWHHLSGTLKVSLEYATNENTGVLLLVHAPSHKLDYEANGLTAFSVEDEYAIPGVILKSEIVGYFYIHDGEVENFRPVTPGLITKSRLQELTGMVQAYVQKRHQGNDIVTQRLRARYLEGQKLNIDRLHKLLIQRGGRLTINYDTEGKEWYFYGLTLNIIKDRLEDYETILASELTAQGEEGADLLLKLLDNITKYNGAYGNYPELTNDMLRFIVSGS